MYNPIPSYDELMSSDNIIFISEADGYYFVWLKHEDKYDNTIWKVDKETHEVMYMAFPEYLVTIHRKAHYIYAVDDWPTN